MRLKTQGISSALPGICRGRNATVATALSALLLAWYCLAGPSQAPAEKRKLNIILITVDTLRAD
ncbi:MAG TPA: hypothetical protein VGQ81_00045, partial [Acidobacteriota bacterium]|nr:hypothetical protein [Acidobacteriota bacterium]